MDNQMRCLLIGPSWVGDMVMAHSLVQVLQKQNPDSVIDVLAPHWSAALLERMPGVRRALTLNVGHGQLGWSERLALGRSLRDKYDQAIVLPNSWKSALVPFLARIPLRTGYIGECRFGLLNDWRKLDKLRLPMTVQRFVALGLPPKNAPKNALKNVSDALLPPVCPTPKLRINQADAHAAAAALSLQTDKPILVLCPGAEYGPAKRWPAAYFVEVGQAMAGQGWDIWVLGSEKDRNTAQEVCVLTGPGCVNLAGRTTLAQAVDVLALASAVVTNDSGLMHVAAALGRPLVAVYGSSDPGFTPPLSETARIVSLGLKCSPCFERECRFGHFDCLKRLHPERVLEILRTLSRHS
jgi:heptosyltransferase-2